MPGGPTVDRDTAASPPPRFSRSMCELAAGGAALLLFIWLAQAVARGVTQSWDDAIRGMLNAHAGRHLTTLMRGFSQMGEPAFLILLGALIIFAHTRSGRPRTAMLFFLVVAGAEIIDQILKYLFHRTRPAAYFGLAEPMGYSFPSGHALVSCAFFGALAVMASARTRSLARKALYYCAASALILAIGISRIYLGVHYPSDVLAGYAMAIVWLCGIALFRRSRAGRRAGS